MTQSRNALLDGPACYGRRRRKVEPVRNFIREVNLPGDDQTVERQRKSRAA